jgi:hypothetical protein
MAAEQYEKDPHNVERTTARVLDRRWRQSGHTETMASLAINNIRKRAALNRNNSA